MEEALALIEGKELESLQIFNDVLRWCCCFGFFSSGRGEGYNIKSCWRMRHSLSPPPPPPSEVQHDSSTSGAGRGRLTTHFRWHSAVAAIMRALLSSLRSWGNQKQKLKKSGITTSMNGSTPVCQSVWSIPWSKNLCSRALARRGQASPAVTFPAPVWRNGPKG